VIRLLSSEVLRFRSRRMVRVLALLAIIGIVVGAVLGTIGSKQPSDQQLQIAQTQRDRQVERCIRRDGLRDAFGPRAEGQTVQEYCEEHIVIEDFVYSEQLRVSELSEYVKASAFIVIVIGLVIGASMVGASWQTGTITTILTWEPRRIRWLLARLIVTAVGVFVVTMALLAILAAALTLGASLRGSTATDPGWFGDLLGTMLRVAAVSTAVAVIGGAVATIGRNTAAALGAVFVYLAVLESLVRGFRPLLSRFMLGDGAVTLIAGTSQEIFDGRTLITLTPAHGATVVAVYVGVLVVAALIMLRSRDVN
jgi:ABC-2 type transport system permease protein